MKLTKEDKELIEKAEEKVKNLRNLVMEVKKLHTHESLLRDEKSKKLEQKDYVLHTFDIHQRFISQTNSRKDFINIMDILISGTENKLKEALSALYDEMEIYK